MKTPNDMYSSMRCIEHTVSSPPDCQPFHLIAGFVNTKTFAVRKIEFCVVTA